jgi:hypothetical protein
LKALFHPLDDREKAQTLKSAPFSFGKKAKLQVMAW